jgi:hypothetical protein
MHVRKPVLKARLETLEAAKVISARPNLGRPEGSTASLPRSRKAQRLRKGITAKMPLRQVGYEGRLNLQIPWWSR